MGETVAFYLCLVLDPLGDDFVLPFNNRGDSMRSWEQQIPIKY